MGFFIIFIFYKMLPLTHRQNKICKVGDMGGKDLRSCFFPLTINSDHVTRQGWITLPRSLASYFSEHYWTLHWFFSHGQEQLCWNSHLLEV